MEETEIYEKTPIYAEMTSTNIFVYFLLVYEYILYIHINIHSIYFYF